jgi:hypothetical protein
LVPSPPGYWEVVDPLTGEPNVMFSGHWGHFLAQNCGILVSSSLPFLQFS